MRRVAMVLLSITAAFAADKDNARFAPKPAASYPGHQTAGAITVAAVPYTSDEDVKLAFGKANPYKYGILPILLIIQNDTGKTLKLDLNVALVDLQNNRTDPMKARDVVLVDGNHVHSYKVPQPGPIPLPPKVHKGPLDTWQIEGRAFAAKLIPPNESAVGFLYFDQDLRPGSYIYLNGISDAATGKGFFYYEVPFEDRKP